MKEIIEDLQNRFEIKDVFHKDPIRTLITVQKNDLTSLLMYMKTFAGYTHLVLLSAVDYIEDDKFQLTYILHNHNLHNYIFVRVFIDRDNPEMESIHKLWKQAATYQRELHEMFGIDFPDSPRVNIPFILEGWEDIPPMRKDFNTIKYSTETFFPRDGRRTYDPKEYMKKKLYSEETDGK